MSALIEYLKRSWPCVDLGLGEGMARSKTLGDYPDLLEEYDEARNSVLVEPKNLTIAQDEASTTPTFWQCRKCGNSYPCSFRDRRRGHQCPFCVGRLVPGYTDFFSLHPHFVAWIDEDQESIDIHSVSSNSRKELNWICPKCETRFQMKPRQITRFESIGKTPCRICREEQNLEGKSIEEIDPDSAALFDPAKNTTSVSRISPGSNSVRYWWLCPMGHDSFLATPYEFRTRRRMCPCCPGSHKLVSGCNDLATTHPEVAERWVHEENAEPPSRVKIGQNINVALWCSNGEDHFAYTYLPSLRKNPLACSACYEESRFVKCGVNDLGCIRADLLDFFVSGQRAPDGKIADAHQISSKDSRQFQWHCLEGEDHIFWRSPYYMTHKRASKPTCPICNNRQIISGLNSLADVFPEIADEWDYQANERNFPSGPSSVPPGGGQTIWWKCKEGIHDSFSSEIYNRTFAGTGCPSCAKTGFKQDELAHLYLVQRGESRFGSPARKLGITNVESSSQRLDLWKRLGFEITFISKVRSGRKVKAAESKILKGWIRDELGIGIWLSPDEMPNGFTETFGPDFPTNEEIIRRINSELSIEP